MLSTDGLSSSSHLNVEESDYILFPKSKLQTMYPTKSVGSLRCNLQNYKVH
jgi:hypothetical protein